MKIMKRTFTKYPQGYVKADTQVYTNLDPNDMYAELDKRFSALNPTGEHYKQFINDSLILHRRYNFITRAEEVALREKYLDGNTYRYSDDN